MFRHAFGVVERILLRRFCTQTTAAGSQSKAAGARLLHQLSRSNVGPAAPTAARNFGFFHSAEKCYTNHKSLAVAIFGLSTVSMGLGYMSKSKYLKTSDIESVEAGAVSKNLHQSEIESVEAGVISKNLRSSEIDHVEAGVVSKNLRPSEIDWVEAGVVSPVVRKQNGCGSCWAMAVVASVEALHCLNTKQSITLSVQELIDCNTTNDGCDGGYCDLALKYIMENGISTESSYPYMGRNSTGGCKMNKTAAAARISEFKLVDRTEDALEEAVAKQPVIVCLQSTKDLKRYKEGIMEYEALPKTLPDGNAVRTHVVLIVGYGTTADGVKYWRFKNSWGKTWGEGGFGRIRRHVADERGVLGIFTTSPVYPVLDSNLGPGFYF